MIFFSKKHTQSSLFFLGTNVKFKNDDVDNTLDIHLTEQTHRNRGGGVQREGERSWRERDNTNTTSRFHPLAISNERANSVSGIPVAS